MWRAFIQVVKDYTHYNLQFHITHKDNVCEIRVSKSTPNRHAVLTKKHTEYIHVLSKCNNPQTVPNPAHTLPKLALKNFPKLRKIMWVK